MIIMNLFIGVIMNSIQESHNELQKVLMRKTKDGAWHPKIAERA
jgi:hypothetical protein